MPFGRRAEVLSGLSGTTCPLLTLFLIGTGRLVRPAAPGSLLFLPVFLTSHVHSPLDWAPRAPYRRVADRLVPQSNGRRE